MHTLCRQTVAFFSVRARGAYVYHCALKC